MMKEVMIHGIKCHIFKYKEDGPVIWWGIGAGQEDVSKVWHLLFDEPGQEQTMLPAFTLIAYEAAEWNRDFSPWAASAVFGKDDFTGEGVKILKWLEQFAIPYARTELYHNQKIVKHILAGYSLAGLFSLWAFYKSELFSGAISCSGSLWYPGWDTFMKDVVSRGKSIVYLSLGDKEEHTKNRAMSIVGDRTRWQYEWLRSEKKVKACKLEWNKGGHFAEPEKRVAKGILWALTKLSSKD